MTTYSLISVCAVLLVTAAGVNLPGVRGQQVPIPRREVGFVYRQGQADAPVKLDVCIDLMCPDSQEAMPHVLQVADHYGPRDLRLTTHLFPLPYHRNAFYAAKGAHVAYLARGGSAVYDWISAMFSNLDTFSNANTHRISDAAVVQKMAELAKQTVNVTVTEFTQLVDSGIVEEDTRVAWKYACTRGVSGTPTFMVNDVLAPATQAWTLAQWTSLIDPLLKTTNIPHAYRP